MLRIYIPIYIVVYGYTTLIDCFAFQNYVNSSISSKQNVISCYISQHFKLIRKWVLCRLLIANLHFITFSILLINLYFGAIIIV